VKLLLVNPSRGLKSEEAFLDFNFEKRVLGLTSLLPLALPTIAGATPEDVETTIVDERIEDINFDEKVDLVGIGGMTLNIKRGYEVADEFRKRGVTVAIGGIHASMMPEEASQHADSVVIGEADCLWSELINDFKEDKLQKFYKVPSFPEMEDIHVPRYDLIKSERYIINQVQTTRGCPFDCDFCSVKAFSGAKFRLKKIEQVIKELEALTPYYTMNVMGYKLKLPKTLFFVDDNIVGNKSYARKLFEAITPMKLSDWYCQSSINVGKDKEMLAMMKEAGCHQMIIGIESVEPDSIAGMNKKINKVEEYYECIDNIQSTGIKVLGTFIVGNDAEDESIFEKTAKFIKDTNLIYNSINLLTPLPGTRLYERLDREGRILHKDWEKYNFESVCFKPKQMSVETLEEGRRWVCQEIYTLNNIHNRYESFLKQKDIMEVKGYEESFNKMPLADRVFSGIMLLKIFYKLNSEQRRFLFKMIKNHFSGKETNFGNTILEISCNDYAHNLLPNKGCSLAS